MQEDISTIPSLKALEALRQRIEALSQVTASIAHNYVRTVIIFSVIMRTIAIFCYIKLILKPITISKLCEHKVISLKALKKKQIIYSQKPYFTELKTNFSIFSNPRTNN